MRRNFVGFTLAEVLITLAIIGVVSAMTLPTVISSYRDRADVAKVKKAYSLIGQALNAAIAEHGDVTTWGSYNNAIDYLGENLKVTKKYSRLYDLYGFNDFVSLMGLKTYNSMLVLAPGVMLNNGMVIGVVNAYYSEIKNVSTRQYSFRIIVDINGKNKPNRFGYDVFIFHVLLNNQLLTDIGYLERCTPNTDSSTDAHPNGESCGKWVIAKGNMDYKKCLNGNTKYCDINYDK